MEQLDLLPRSTALIIPNSSASNSSRRERHTGSPPIMISSFVHLSITELFIKLNEILFFLDKSFPTQKPDSLPTFDKYCQLLKLYLGKSLNEESFPRLISAIKTDLVVCETLFPLLSHPLKLIKAELNHSKKTILSASDKSSSSRRFKRTTSILKKSSKELKSDDNGFLEFRRKQLLAIHESFFSSDTKINPQFHLDAEKLDGIIRSISVIMEEITATSKLRDLFPYEEAFQNALRVYFAYLLSIQIFEKQLMGEFEILEFDCMALVEFANLKMSIFSEIKKILPQSAKDLPYNRYLEAAFIQQIIELIYRFEPSSAPIPRTNYGYFFHRFASDLAEALSRCRELDSYTPLFETLSEFALPAIFLRNQAEKKIDQVHEKWDLVLAQRKAAHEAYLSAVFAWSDHFASSPSHPNSSLPAERSLNWNNSESLRWKYSNIDLSTSYHDQLKKYSLLNNTSSPREQVFLAESRTFGTKVNAEDLLPSQFGGDGLASINIGNLGIDLVIDAGGHGFQSGQTAKAAAVAFIQTFMNGMRKKYRGYSHIRELIIKALAAVDMVCSDHSRYEKLTLSYSISLFNAHINSNRNATVVFIGGIGDCKREIRLNTGALIDLHPDQPALLASDGKQFTGGGMMTDERGSLGNDRLFEDFNRRLIGSPAHFMGFQSALIVHPGDQISLQSDGIHDNFTPINLKKTPWEVFNELKSEGYLDDSVEFPENLPRETFEEMIHAFTKLSTSDQSKKTNRPDFTLEKLWCEPCSDLVVPFLNMIYRKSIEINKIKFWNFDEMINFVTAFDGRRVALEKVRNSLASRAVENRTQLAKIEEMIKRGNTNDSLLAEKNELEEIGKQIENSEKELLIESIRIPGKPDDKTILRRLF
jgi:hypothetical protein